MAQVEMREAQQWEKANPHSRKGKARAKSTGDTWAAMYNLSSALIGLEETGIMAASIDRDIAGEASNDN